MMCSTLKEYFSGNRELFRGLKIDAMEKEWVKFPILNITFAKAKDVTVESINAIINRMLDEFEADFGLSKNSDDSGVRLSDIIKSAFQKTGKKVVVIIDEYDAAMLDTVDNDELQNKVRAIQNKFFSPLKERIHPFCFYNGHHKVFADVDIFGVEQFGGHLFAAGIRDDLRHFDGRISYNVEA